MTTCPIHEAAQDLLNTNEADLYTEEAAAILGITSGATVRNWLLGGHFPGAYKDPSNLWRFPIKAVREAKSKMRDIEFLNKMRSVGIPIDLPDSNEEPPLL
jgi:hypothetical protein